MNDQIRDMFIRALERHKQQAARSPYYRRVFNNHRKSDTLNIEEIEEAVKKPTSHYEDESLWFY